VTNKFLILLQKRRGDQVVSVAREERSESRGRPSGWWIVPGLRFTPSGLRKMVSKSSAVLDGEDDDMAL